MAYYQSRDEDLDQAEQAGHEQEDTTSAIVNELVKSYGFNRDYKTGDWSWDVETIGKAFKDDPLWSTLDYVALVFPVAKWGSAMKAVKAGSAASGAIGQGLKAGRFAGKTAESRVGRTLGKITGNSETAAAAEMYMRSGIKPGRIRSAITNPIGTQVDDDFIKLVDEFGSTPWEQRGLSKMYERERLFEEGLKQRKAAEIQRLWQRSDLSGAQLTRGVRFLEGGVDPADNLVRTALGEKGQEAYRQTFTYRNAIHEDAFDMGLISRETYERNLNTYAPRLYEEWQRIHESNAALRQMGGTAAAVAGAATGATARFLGRKGPEVEALTRIMDPRASLEELGGAGMVIARQRYARNLADSVIAKEADEVFGVAEEIFNGNTKLQKLHGISDEKLAVMRALADDLDTVGRPQTVEAVAQEMGWKTIDQLFEGEKIPGYIGRLPDELRNKYLDPAAANDILGVLRFSADDGRLTNLYKKILSTFRASKTAYNPATNVRNGIGAMIFHHLTTGGIPTIVPHKGIRAFLDKTEDFDDALKAGLVGSAFDAEIREAIRVGFNNTTKKGRGQATAIDWMGDSTLAQVAQKGASKLENFYRGTDEVWKIDAFITQKNKYLKAGLAPDMAKSRAAVDVNKFMPTFSQHSDFTNAIRPIIPFASFTTEALRNWKNALAERPHIAFFWNHMAETMSQTFAAMSGISQEDMQGAKEALPNYMKGKQLLMLPFDVDGRKTFIDMSYTIPLANLVEAQDGKKLFFGELFDPGANPLMNMGTAVLSNKDPFSGREIAPRFTEQQLGIPVTNQTARRALGLVEHAAQMMLPPLVPPGYAGVNLLELARGTKNPKSGEDMEKGVLRTILANVAGIRGYSPTVESQVQNVRSEQRESSKLVSQAWRRWEFAKANDDVESMKRERFRIIGLKKQENHDNPESYFEKGIKRHTPGSFSGLGTRQLKEIVGRSSRLSDLNPTDASQRELLQQRLAGRKNR